MDTAFIVCSTFSAGMSASVLLTGIIFVEMRKRLFMKITMFIALSASLASIASAFGLVSNETVLCPIQAFMTTWLYSASWMWTTALSFHLYSIVFYGYFVQRPWAMHFICWIIPLSTTLIPLSVAKFGRDSNDYDLGWCTLKSNEPSSTIYVIMEFVSKPLLLLLCLLITVSLLLHISWRYRSMNIKETYPELFSIFQCMVLYPAGFIFTWLPIVIFRALLNLRLVDHRSKSTEDVFNILAIWATQSGTMLALTFFWKSEEARMRWTELVYGLKWRDASSSLVSNLIENGGSSITTFVDESVYARTTVSSGRPTGRKSLGAATVPNSQMLNSDFESPRTSIIPGSPEERSVFGVPETTSSAVSGSHTAWIQYLRGSSGVAPPEL